jgi:CubicO group peptidase (beta-lactamase class C family)
VSTAQDYARFVRIFLGRGTVNGRRLLSRRSIDEMTHDQLGGLPVELQPTTDPSKARPFPDGAGQDTFGLGFQIAAGAKPGMRPPGALSWSGLYNTHFWIDEPAGVAGLLMVQLLPFYDEACTELWRDFERAVYANLRELRGASQPARTRLFSRR